MTGYVSGGGVRPEFADVVEDSVKPWTWCEDEHSWVRLADNHVIVARIRPPSIERKKANCTIYGHAGLIGRTSDTLQGAAQWCDKELVKLGFKLKIGENPVSEPEAEKGYRWLWLRFWSGMESI